MAKRSRKQPKKDGLTKIGEPVRPIELEVERETMYIPPRVGFVERPTEVSPAIVERFEEDDEADEPPEPDDGSHVADPEDDDGDVEPSEGGEDDQADEPEPQPELNPLLAEGEIDERLHDPDDVDVARVIELRSEAEQAAIEERLADEPGECPMCNGTGKYDNFSTGELETCSRCQGFGIVPVPISEGWVGETKSEPVA